MLTASGLDQLCSLFSSRQWSECLDICSSIQISDLDSEQTCLFFILYLRTILSLKSPKNSDAWKLILSYYKTTSQIPIQICIVEVHVLVALNFPKEASNLCQSLYSTSNAEEILELHLFSVIIPHSLMSKTEIFTWLDGKCQEYQLDVQKYLIRIKKDHPLPSTKRIIKFLNRLDLVPFRNASIIILLVLLLRYFRYKYKTV
jgi:hypothetical protein